MLFASLPVVLVSGQLRKETSASLCSSCVTADMNFLASDELNGRGSGTSDEHIAALYAASLLQSFGLEPGGDQGSFLQRAPLPATFPPQVAQRAPGPDSRPDEKRIQKEGSNRIRIRSGSGSDHV